MTLRFLIRYLPLILFCNSFTSVSGQIGQKRSGLNLESMRYSGGSLVDVRLRRLSQHLNIETVTAESYFRLICPSENDFNAYLAGTYTLIDQQLSFEVGKAITDQNLVTFKVSIFNSLIGKYARTKTNLRKL